MIYSGPISAGQMHGHGRITYANTETYEGDIFYGKRQGKGKYTYIDGGVYEGDWFDDKPHGKGKCKYANGFRYFSSFLLITRYISPLFILTLYINSISPKQFFLDIPFPGNVYEGDWFEGRIHGYGRLDYIEGDSYEGEWKVYISPHTCL